jgi:phytoene/squalene synthetase
VVVIEVGQFDTVGDQAEEHLSKVEIEPGVFRKLQDGREQWLLQGQYPVRRLEEEVYPLCGRTALELQVRQGCRLME